MLKFGWFSKRFTQISWKKCLLSCKSNIPETLVTNYLDPWIRVSSEFWQKTKRRLCISLLIVVLFFFVPYYIMNQTVFNHFYLSSLYILVRTTQTTFKISKNKCKLIQYTNQEVYVTSSVSKGQFVCKVCRYLNCQSNLTRKKDYNDKNATF